MLRIDIITLFPEVIRSYVGESILGRAIKSKKIRIDAHQLRSYASNSYSQVDDKPYGGGPGMLLIVQPIFAAIKKNRLKRGKTAVIVTAASGKLFTQADAKRLATYDQLLFVCGRYEGIDHRVEENLADEIFSIGPYVLTGGELPALVMADAIARNVPGVLGKESSLDEESHSKEGVLEYPQFTKPEHFVFRKGLRKTTWSVPKILLSGDHKKIKDWRKKQSDLK